MVIKGACRPGLQVYLLRVYLLLNSLLNRLHRLLEQRSSISDKSLVNGGLLEDSLGDNSFRNDALLNSKRPRQYPPGQPF